MPLEKVKTWVWYTWRFFFVSRPLMLSRRFFFFSNSRLSILAFNGRAIPCVLAQRKNSRAKVAAFTCAHHRFCSCFFFFFDSPWAQFNTFAWSCLSPNETNNNNKQKKDYYIYTQAKKKKQIGFKRYFFYFYFYKNLSMCFFLFLPPLHKLHL